MSTVALREERASLFNQARGILDLHDNLGTTPNAEERATFDRLMSAADKLEERFTAIESRSRLEAAERSVAETRHYQPGRQPDETRLYRESEQYRADYGEFLRSGQITTELRALQADIDPAGGYLTAPQQFSESLIKAIDNALVIRQLATKEVVTASQSLGVPTLDNDPADATFTTELSIGGEDSTMSFGKRELHPRPVAKYVKVSNKLLRVAVNAERIVRDRLAYKFSVAAENAYMNGSGANQPLGLFTASSSGISTARDISTDMTATTITADGLINVLYSLKSQYLSSPSLRWLFHRDAMKQIRKLKSGDAQYLLVPGLTVGGSDVLLGVQIALSEYAPSTFTTGLYVGLLGDLSYYWIADLQTIVIQRLVELFAAINMVAFIGRMETDGAPVLEEAFSRIKLA